MANRQRTFGALEHPDWRGCGLGKGTQGRRGTHETTSCALTPLFLHPQAMTNSAVCEHMHAHAYFYYDSKYLQN